MNDVHNKNEKYISIFSREVKKTFNSFAGLSDTLLDGFDFVSNDEKFNYIKQLNEEINTSINKFQNIFHWINYKSGNYSYYSQMIQISDCINDIIKNVSSYSDRKKITLQTDIEPGLHVNADLQMLNTIVCNLLYNAVEVSSVYSKIIVQSFNTAGIIKISVHDYGTGVSEATKAKLLYNKPIKISKEIENESPIGVGSLLVKEFVLRNGGELWLDSEINEGSKFTFTLANGDFGSTK
jgi:two-component system, sensor histidine kinase and response regulator